MATALSPGGYVRQGQRGVSPPRSVNVQVAVRCRPLNDRERTAGERHVVQCSSDRREVQCTPPVAPRKPASSSANPKKTYTYDHVFGPTATQADVYEGVVESIVDEVLQGYNCTVFAYGQTGTGKTHTMEGARDADMVGIEERRLADNAGIIPRAVKQVFDHLRSITDEHSVRVSHLELYNEQLTDLLGPEDNFTESLRMYEDPHKGTFVQGLEDIVVRSEEEIFTVLDRSAVKRRTAETLMNKYSSRSHSVFSITIHIKESTPEGADLLKVGKLNLVDLAGSENVGRSGAVKGRAREAGNINQSLLTLGRVITALVDRHPHVPYRDSKLTRLLQESLGGRNKTCVIATVTPGSNSLEETSSTLDYAYRAKSIKNRPTVNQMIAKHVLLKEYTEEIQKLKKELDANRTKNGVFLPPEEFERLQIIANQQKEAISQLESKSEDYEKKTSVLKEKLERTQNALLRHQRDLALTKENLQEVSADLESTRSNLAVVAQQKNENAHLVRNHVATEQALHTQGSTLQDTVSLCVNDISALHQRVDAKLHLEKKNVENLTTLQNTVDGNIGVICESLKAHEAEQLTLSSGTGAKLDEISATIEENLKAIGALVSHFSKHFADLERGDVATGNELMELVQNCTREELQNLRREIVEESNLVHAAEKNTTELGGVISRSLTDGLRSIASLRAFIRENISNREKRETTFLQDLMKSFEDLKKAIGEQQEDQIAIIEQMKLANAAESVKHKDAISHTQEEILKQVADSFARFALDSNKRMETAKDTADEHISKVLEHSAQIDKTLAETSTAFTVKTVQFAEGTRKEANGAEATVEQAANSISTVSASASTAVEDVNSCMRDLMSKTRDWQAKTDRSISSIHSAHGQYRNDCANKWAQQSVNRSEAVNEMQDQSSHISAAIQNSLSTARSQIHDDLEQGRMKLSSAAVQIANSMATDVNGVVKSHAVLQDCAQHETPMVRQWPIRERLACTRDHRDILQEVRSESDLPDVPIENFSRSEHLGGLPRSVSSSGIGSLSSENSYTTDYKETDVEVFRDESDMPGQKEDVSETIKGVAANPFEAKEEKIVEVPVPEEGSEWASVEGTEEENDGEAVPILSDTTNRRTRGRPKKIANAPIHKKPSGIPGPRTRGMRRIGQ